VGEGTEIMTAATYEQSYYPRTLYAILRLLLVPALIVCIVMSVLVLNIARPLESTTALTLPQIYFQVLFAEPLTIVIGWLIMRRVPGNICGPTLVLWGCSIWGGAAFNTDIVPVQYIAQFFNQGIGFIGLFLLLLYFPTGTVEKRWMNWMGLVFFFFSMGYALLNVVSDGFADNGNVNPFYIPALSFVSPVIEGNFGAFLVPFGSLCIFLLIGRYLRSYGVMRQQMRWMAFAAGTFLIILSAWIIGIAIPALWVGLFRDIVLTLSATWFYLAFPLALGVSILRHRLYDIDIIIRRTLIYTVLTTILGIVYFGGTVLTQQVFRSLTGQSSEPAIVVSTLLIAALFAPLRRRVQDVIDRRLYRKKYDAEKVLADFQKNLRDEVDMETLKANLIGVLDDTMQPTRIALWVKEPKS
jgi:hypothetical protein